MKKLILLIAAALALSSCALVPSPFESSQCSVYRTQYYNGKFNRFGCYDCFGYHDLAGLIKADHQMNPWSMR